MQNGEIKYYIFKNYFEDLKNLPWNQPLEEWNDRNIKFIQFRKGLSRHTVRFVKVNKNSFAIKETTEESAVSELKNYEELLKKGIHTLTPVGYVLHKKPVIEVNTKIGSAFIPDNTAFIITLLDDKSLPESHLYKLNFKKENRFIIWNAIAVLFADLHFNNIYWGDASLSNILVRFVKVRDEKGRTRTELKSILADAETVLFLPKLSPKMKNEELNFFFESMEWLNEDYRKSGLKRELFSIPEGKKYFTKKYKSRISLLRKMKNFESNTGLNTKKYFYPLFNIKTLEEILKQINEHKWYLSEIAGNEIELKTAAKDWVENIYIKIIKEFEKLNIFEHFPFMTPSSLYLEVMTHKYYMSEKKGIDVGIDAAITDFCKLTVTDKSFYAILKKVTKRIIKLIPRFNNK